MCLDVMRPECEEPAFQPVCGRQMLRASGRGESVTGGGSDPGARPLRPTLQLGFLKSSLVGVEEGRTGSRGSSQEEPSAGVLVQDG